MPGEHPILYSAAALLVAFVVWLVLAARRNHAINASYGLVLCGGSGGSGDLQYRDGERVAYVWCELLMGATDYALHAQDLCWTSPEVRSFTPAERQQFFVRLQAWADAHRLRFEIYAPDVPNDNRVK